MGLVVPGREPVWWGAEGGGEVGEEREAEGVAVVLEGCEGAEVRLEGEGEGLGEGLVGEGWAYVECSGEERS